MTKRTIFLPIFFIASVLFLLAPQDIILSHRMRFEEIGYPTSEANLANLRKACGKNMTVLMGDSWALQGVDPRLLGPNFISITFGGATPIEIYLLAKNRWKCAEWPKNVILSFAPHHFFYEDGYWAFQERIATINDRLDIRRDSYRLHDDAVYSLWHLPNLDMASKINEIVRELQLPSLYFSRYEDSLFDSKLKENMATYDDMIGESRGFYSQGDTTPDNLEGEPHEILKDFVPSPVVDENFDKLLKLLNSRGISIFFLPMPISEITSHEMTAAFRNGFIDYINKKGADNNMKVIGNFFTPYPNNCYHDSGHLRTRCSKIWTRQIAPLMP
ncbi:MAG: hypothetical protein KGI37_08890 [Alphaproteobacteria bacterium]|nr:hypothetical protein [Alphaproteobacteria bacterium]